MLSSVQGCNPELPAPELTKLRLPVGIQLSPDGNWLFISNSNLDRKYAASSLLTINLNALFAALANNPSECEISELHPQIVGCKAENFINKIHSLQLPSGAGNIAFDLPAGAMGPWRLLLPSRIDRTITWIDVYQSENGEIDLECNQDEARICGEEHILTYLKNQQTNARLPRDPARLIVDDQGFRFAYLPHLLGSNLTLIALDGNGGPEIVDIVSEFYRSDPFQSESERAGGFSVAGRACQLDQTANITDGCMQPLLYTSQRFYPGLRQFTVQPGSRIIQEGGFRIVLGSNPEVVEDRPYVADLQFIDPKIGSELLVVQTTPPALVRIDTSVNEEGSTVDKVSGTVGLCRNPNLLTISRPKQEEWLAFVSCYADDEIVAVALGAFVKVASIPVGDGPNEMVVDEIRQKLYVVNTLENSLAIIELSRKSPQFLQTIAYIE